MSSSSEFDNVFQAALAVPLSWQLLETVRQTVSTMTSHLGEAMNDAAVMVASELAENIIKYGEPLSTLEGGQLTVFIDQQSIRIESINGIRSEERAQALLATIEQISRGSPFEMYVERLHQMLHGSEASAARLGLLRIASEGQFAIRGIWNRPSMTIVAERQLGL